LDPWGGDPGSTKTGQHPASRGEAVPTGARNAVICRPLVCPSLVSPLPGSTMGNFRRVTRSSWGLSVLRVRRRDSFALGASSVAVAGGLQTGSDTGLERPPGIHKTPVSTPESGVVAHTGFEPVLPPSTPTAHTHLGLQNGCSWRGVPGRMEEIPGNGLVAHMGDSPS